VCWVEMCVSKSWKASRQNTNEKNVESAWPLSHSLGGQVGWREMAGAQLCVSGIRRPYQLACAGTMAGG